MESYDVFLGQEPVGKAYAEAEGLYYRFRCRCNMSGDVMYRVVVSCGDRHENLGVLIPMGDVFGLDTRLAVKRIGKGLLRFRVLPKHSGMNEKFIPLSPDEPFAYIHRIRDAYLSRKNGKIGIVILK